MLTNDKLLEKKEMYELELEKILSDNHEAEIEQEVAKFKATLVEKYALVKKKDLEKVQSYLELLETLIEEAEIETNEQETESAETAATVEEDAVSVHENVTNACW